MVCGPKRVRSPHLVGVETDALADVHTFDADDDGERPLTFAEMLAAARAMRRSMTGVMKARLQWEGLEAAAEAYRPRRSFRRSD
ncbi:hypothetical protein [Lacipirellula sp.]|uniref:hypothetical protein n=1 Tax=Lacipirellula sp. TaxID=2691419 RepID=UPI003D0BD5FD